jgi:hypothetical protein
MLVCSIHVPIARVAFNGALPWALRFAHVSSLVINRFFASVARTFFLEGN